MTHKIYGQNVIVFGGDDGSDISGKLYYGGMNLTGIKPSVTIAGLTKMPKMIYFMAYKASGNTTNNVWVVAYPNPSDNDANHSYYVGKSNYGTQEPPTFDESTKLLTIPTGNYSVNGYFFYYIIE